MIYKNRSINDHVSRDGLGLGVVVGSIPVRGVYTRGRRHGALTCVSGRWTATTDRMGIAVGAVATIYDVFARRRMHRDIFQRRRVGGQRQRHTRFLDGSGVWHAGRARI